MTENSPLAAFPIAARWPAADPSAIQLYSFPTPNGVKVSAMLEETGLRYEAHRVTLADADVKSPEFLSLNPNNKIPAIIDPDGPDGQPIGLFESGAILIYLAEKTGRFIGSTAAERAETIQWLMWQMAGPGPMFGQLGYFAKFAGAEIEDPRPRARYLAEARRLLGVLDRRLEGRDWITGAYSVADIATGPWVRTLTATYGVGEALELDSFSNVTAWRDRFLARPAVQRALDIPPREI
ncbi:glutathione S-transferase N-terminal domain-containing protein [Mangrovicoccus sp. HB161399]|uniref:glutathione S-transferase N-terminal domain-containing protein n=1 Tax=Mangrovicoccus sp. HB161399 TaxID=2720392 RepID=UPI0015550C2C|nr:glutathione S-transferase N-terminal domain-containing protein [Mangrovicoccus sp. HB161399]